MSITQQNIMTMMLKNLLKRTLPIMNISVFCQQPNKNGKLVILYCKIWFDLNHIYTTNLSFVSFDCNRERCLKINCDYYFSIDSNARLTNEKTLIHLIEQNRLAYNNHTTVCLQLIKCIYLILQKSDSSFIGSQWKVLVKFLGRAFFGRLLRSFS